MSITGMPQAGESADLQNMSLGGLVSLVRQLQRRVETLERENAALRTENAVLREQLRAAKGPAAPFSKGPGPGISKKPGRHRRKGRFERREEPVPGPADRVEELRAPLDLPDRPQCGARLESTERVATVEDTPPEPFRISRRSHVKHAVCAVCGWSGRGRHADPAPGRHGATAHRIGSRLMARAPALHCDLGLPLCNAPAVIRIRRRHRHQEVVKMLGVRFAGLLETDRCASYERLLDRIGRQHDNGRVPLLLERPEMGPANNRAERGLRGTVIVPRMPHCFKNERGTWTYEVMKNITAILAQCSHRVCRVLNDMTSGQSMPGAVLR